MDGETLQEWPATCDGAVAAARALFPYRSRLAAQGEPTGKYRTLIERLLKGTPPRPDWFRYCGQVVHFVLTLAKLESQSRESESVHGVLMNLVDFCDGIPADAAVVNLLAGLHSTQAPRTQAVVAECVARLDGGLVVARPMFLSLLHHGTTKIRVRAATALSRALRSHVQGTTEVGLSIAVLNRRRTNCWGALHECKKWLASLEVSPDVRSVLLEQGVLSSTDYLVHEQEQDEEYFRQHKSPLLAQHKGEFVAVYNRTFIGFAKQVAKLQHMVDMQCGKNARAFIVLVTADAFEERPDAHIVGEDRDGIPQLPRDTGQEALDSH